MLSFSQRQYQTPQQMETQPNFNSAIRFVRSISTMIYTPRVDSYYEHQNGILHYDVEVPGVRRGHLRVILGNSPLLRHRSIIVWGVSVAPHWPIPSYLLSQEDIVGSSPVVSPLVHARASSGQPNRSSSTSTIAPSTITPIVSTVDRPQHQTMERAHGEFYRLLNVPAKTQVSDINVILANGSLSILIKCNEPLTPDELEVTQEMNVSPLLLVAVFFAAFARMVT
ncbi:hypothetical protein F5879DRAFT_991544 [Lentinula edodes]|nr:hypothetical protein F5879DRAFT_991544 [Lentinula edodes]